MTFHIVEDESALREVLKLVFMNWGCAVVAHQSWDTCHPTPGDVVLADVHGVGTPTVAPGVEVYTMSASPTHMVDLKKPFDMDDIGQFIQVHSTPPTLKHA